MGRSGRAGWLAIAAVVVWPAVEALRIIVQPVHEVVFGDLALFELAARDAWQFHQLLGPSAHPGFNHLGPAMFYLLAPAVHLLQPGPGMYLGAVLINAAALAAIVGFVWRQAGVRAALWSAAALNLFCLALNLDTLRQPWNPLLLIIPMVLFVVLCAGVVTRTEGAWVWAAVVGSYEIQTHVTTALFVAVMVSLAALWAVVGTCRRPVPRHPRGWWHRPPRLTGFCGLVLIWLPSTVELFADHPNNFDKIRQWAGHGHSQTIALPTAFGTVLRSIAISPFNPPHTSRLFGSLTWWAAPLPPSRSKEVAALLILGVGLASIRWLIRRQQHFAVALSCSAMLAIPLAMLTVTQARDDYFAFLTGWVTFVPCVLLLALGVGLFAPRKPRHTTVESPTVSPPVGRRTHFAPGATALLAVAAVACASVAWVSDLRQPSMANVSKLAATITPVVADAKAQLKAGDRWVGILIASPGDYIIAADVVLELERVGYHTVVDPRYVNLFGTRRSVLHPVQVLFSFYLTNDPAGAQLALGHPVSNVGGTVMTVWRTTG